MGSGNQTVSKQNWQFQHIDSYHELAQNIFTHQKFNFYKAALPTLQLEKDQPIYQWRKSAIKKNRYFPKIMEFVTRKRSKQCSNICHMFSQGEQLLDVYMFTEVLIPLKSQIHKYKVLSPEQKINLVKDWICGIQELWKKFGYFELEFWMLYMNQNQEGKIWINRNLIMNEFEKKTRVSSYSEQGRNQRQAQCMDKICSTKLFHNLPYEFKVLTKFKEVKQFGKYNRNTWEPSNRLIPSQELTLPFFNESFSKSKSMSKPTLPSNNFPENSNHSINYAGLKNSKEYYRKSQEEQQNAKVLANQKFMQTSLNNNFRSPPLVQQLKKPEKQEIPRKKKKTSNSDFRKEKDDIALVDSMIIMEEKSQDSELYAVMEESVILRGRNERYLDALL